MSDLQKPVTENVTHIPANLAVIRQRIAAACRRAGRDADEITIVGVTKIKPVEVLRGAFAAGIHDVGENYVQELVAKHDELAGEFGAEMRWHFIGHLQRNKVRQVIQFVSVIHAVDSVRLGEEISKHALAIGRRIPILLQVNTSGEESKYGVPPEAASALAQGLVELPGLDVQGLMTLAAYLDDPEATRPMFRLLRTVRDRLRDETSHVLPHLSMGMTSDFEVAIEEGATMVRIGTALFGERLKF